MRPVDGARRRWPFLDHVITTYGHYQKAGGDREAAALTYQGFLAVFPVVLMATSVLGYVIRDADTVRTSILNSADRVIPGSRLMLAESLDTISKRAGAIGVVALLGLVWTGIGVVSTVREALERAFRVESEGGVKGKLRDLRFVGVLGGLMLISIALASLSAGALNSILRGLGVDTTLVRATGIGVAFGLTFLADLALFLVLFTVLPAHSYGWRDNFSAAVVAAIGWTVLKTVGGWYITTSSSRASAAYGVAATILGLLLAINLAARLTLFSAHWAADVCRRRHG